MKIFQTPEAPYLMRVNIKKQGDKTEYVTLCETSQQNCFEFIKKLIQEQNLSIFESGRKTNVEIREANGSKNGKSVSISFKGLSPLKVKEIIVKSFEVNKN